MTKWWEDHPEPERVAALMDDISRFTLALQAGTPVRAEQFLAILQTAAELAAVQGAEQR